MSVFRLFTFTSFFRYSEHQQLLLLSHMTLILLTLMLFVFIIVKLYKTKMKIYEVICFLITTIILNSLPMLILVFLFALAIESGHFP
jgi:hypothetical protein